MNQFYISLDKEAEAARCRDSVMFKLPILITGMSIDGRVEAFDGIVQSVDEDKGRGAGKRFKITIRD
jgi:hypothetical protein